MKRISLFLMVVFMIGGLAMAQKQEQKEATPEVRAQKMTQRMVKKLSLTPEQAKQLQKVNLDFATQMKAGAMERKELKNRSACDSCKKVMKEKKIEMKEMRAVMKEAAMERDTQLKNILTKEQYELYQKDMEQKADRKETSRTMKHRN